MTWFCKADDGTSVSFPFAFVRFTRFKCTTFDRGIFHLMTVRCGCICDSLVSIEEIRFSLLVMDCSIKEYFTRYIF